MEIPVRSYYISDKAFNYLVTLAQIQGYVRYGSSKVKGISDFLNDLAEMSFEDTRPAITRETHAEQAARNRAPVWFKYYRRNRLLKLNNKAITKYIKVAYEVEIVKMEPYVVGGVSRYTPYPAISAVLEGIGISWITPNNLPKRGRYAGQ